MVTEPVTSDNIVFDAAENAIRTTLPDGRVALNNIIDKFTGESIQLVKVPSLPNAIAADGIVYFETDNPNFGVEYWQRVLIDGLVNVRWFGAVCDYRDASRTDNSAAITNAIQLMKSLVADQALNDSKQNTYALFFPSDQQGYGYYVEVDLDFGGGYNIQMDAPLYRGGTKPANGAFVTVGRGSDGDRLSNRHKDHKLWVRTEGISWVGGEYFGIVVKNHVRTKINVVESRNFECGVRFYGHNSPFSYNSDIFVGEIINSRIGLDFWATGTGSSGYTTSCIITINRIGQDSITNQEAFQMDRVGIRLDSASYISESLTFNGGVIEGLKPSNFPDVEGIPVHIIFGQRHRFYNFRHEGNSAVFLKTEIHSRNYGNTAELTYSSVQNPALLLETGRAFNHVSDRRADIVFSGIGRGRTLYNSGDLVSRAKETVTGGLYIEGFERRFETGTYSYYQPASTSIVNNYINLAGPGGNMGFLVDSRFVKEFIVNINQDPTAVCTLHMQFFDSNMALIPLSNTPCHAPFNNSGILDEGIRNYNPFYAASSSDFYFKLSEEVAYTRMLFYATQQQGAGFYVARISAISLLSIQGRYEAPVSVSSTISESGNTVNRPGSPWIGMQWFDITLGQPIYRGNNGWVDALGNAV